MMCLKAYFKKQSIEIKKYHRVSELKLFSLDSLTHGGVRGRRLDTASYSIAPYGAGYSVVVKI